MPTAARPSADWCSTMPARISSPLGQPPVQLKKSPLTPTVVICGDAARSIDDTRSRPLIVPFESSGVSLYRPCGFGAVTTYMTTGPGRCPAQNALVRHARHKLRRPRDADGARPATQRRRRREACDAYDPASRYRRQRRSSPLLPFSLQPQRETRAVAAQPPRADPDVPRDRRRPRRARAFPNLFVRAWDFAAQMQLARRARLSRRHAAPRVRVLAARDAVARASDRALLRRRHARSGDARAAGASPLGLARRAQPEGATRSSSPLPLPAWRVRDDARRGLGARRAHDHASRPHAVDDAELWRQVHGSRVELQQRFHVPVDFFCYPAGRYDARVIAAVELAGYLGATTTNYGLGAAARHLHPRAASASTARTASPASRRSCRV